MPKKKVHTSHHMQKKWHKNGIKKPKTYVKTTTQDCYLKLRKNTKYAKMHDKNQNPKKTKLRKPMTDSKKKKKQS